MNKIIFANCLTKKIPPPPWSICPRLPVLMKTIGCFGSKSSSLRGNSQPSSTKPRVNLQLVFIFYPQRKTIITKYFEIYNIPQLHLYQGRVSTLVPSEGREGWWRPRNCDRQQLGHSGRTWIRIQTFIINSRVN